MPTATTTVTKVHLSAQFPLKAGVKHSLSSPLAQPTSPTTTAQTSTTITLRSLYNRAARAFVLRDIALTYSLLQSAFELLKPPTSIPDSLADHRRKWDILRITLESTIYVSRPSLDSLPEPLRALLSEAPQTLATSIYNRSLSLFTLSSGNPQKCVLNAAHLPIQVLITLIYSSLKINAPDVGRIMIEEWLARREPQYSFSSDSHAHQDDGYTKVLDLYCLHILPRLEQWDYAKEFLTYENELSETRREYLKTTLSHIYEETMDARRPSKSPQIPIVSSQPSSPRSYSPAPSSSSSSSSSLSTISTQTVVPATLRGNQSLSHTNGFTKLSQVSSSSSISSSNTATPHVKHGSLIPNGNGNALFSHNHSKSRTQSSDSSVHSRPNLASQFSVRPTAPSTYAVIRASIAPYLTNTRVTTFILLFVMIPLISFFLRMRRRRKLLAIGTATTATAVSAVTMSNVDLVRRRLLASNGGGGLVKKMWGEVVRAVVDTVKMAGSGLV